MKLELWNLIIQNSYIDAYISRFSELSLLYLGMITYEGKKIERFIWGSTSPIQGNVIAANPDMYDSAKTLAKKLYDHGNKKGVKIVDTENKKRKERIRKTGTTNEKYEKIKGNRNSNKL